MGSCPSIVAMLGSAVVLATALHAQLPAGVVFHSESLHIGENGFIEGVDPGDIFGGSVAWTDDSDGDGTPDLVVGAPESAEPGGSTLGAAWILSQLGEPATLTGQKIGGSSPLLATVLRPSMR